MGPPHLDLCRLRDASLGSIKNTDHLVLKTCESQILARKHVFVVTGVFEVSIMSIAAQFRPYIIMYPQKRFQAPNVKAVFGGFPFALRWSIFPFWHAL